MSGIPINTRLTVAEQSLHAGIDSKGNGALFTANHPLFIRGLLDPSEDALVSTANDFAGDYKKLLALAERPDVPGGHSLTELSLAETLKYREFTSTETMTPMVCSVRSSWKLHSRAG